MDFERMLALLFFFFSHCENEDAALTPSKEQIMGIYDVFINSA